ncbi:LacI family transcriptional regulator [Mycolicibacterium parafortuitum]|uniref:LacI family transcriptional regulator n=1 Tax=Mycolicibacterium parafortuitum TaxID=39692 RepID=A0A7I7TZN5_MYCPF|nr:LacI family DNA-binding transcriptional regulator [Mycolicibacterium parafortuitum]PQE01344.1 LacI family transcriptional regulator [Mycobacterium sp. EPG1]BBY74071.1 LacI family transcriptional regulator [Mycolicibacterium parafortuitum]
MADVAERAGVSRTLVSFILDGKPGASDETRQRVLAIADEIGYRPDAAARLLAQGRSRTLGVMLDVRQLFQAELVTHLYPAAEHLGYEVLLSANLPDRTEPTVVESLLSHRCGALVLLGPTSDAAYLRQLADRVPVVVAGRRLAGVNTECPLATVRTNDTKGIRQAIDYLVGLGHRRIHHVDGGTDPGSADRLRAYRSAMRAHGLGDEIVVIPGAHNEEAGAAAARTMLAESELPTAVLAGNDRCALGVLDVFTRAGVDVPGQVSLMGYDDSRLSENPRIDLTTIHQDAREIARHAVDLAVHMLVDGPSRAADVVLEPTLVVRGTTAPPRD